MSGIDVNYGYEKGKWIRNVKNWMKGLARDSENIRIQSK